MQNALARDALLRLADSHQLPRVRDGLRPVAEDLARDLCALEEQLGALICAEESKVAAAAAHLLAAGGKRVRPMVCLLACSVLGGERPGCSVIDLAMVAEAAHNATLLHDDVLDLGEVRRGKPASRVVFGNGASVLGGDLLLVRTLELIHRSGIPELMGSMITVLDRMVAAEAIQLEHRGVIDVPISTYFQIVEGKTASLFEWAMEAGARSADSTEEQVDRLRTFGRELGFAFQLLDDLLDLTQDPEALGKSVLRDLAGGTMTYPVLVALRHSPDLGRRLGAAAAGEDDPSLVTDLLETMASCGGLTDTRQRVARHTRAALDALADLPPSPALQALSSVAKALAERAQ